jgi:hypothetical protein
LAALLLNVIETFKKEDGPTYQANEGMIDIVNVFTPAGLIEQHGIRQET